MQTNKVDIILPIFDCEDYLEQTMKSIIEQSFKNWRLILIDDNSNFKTKKILSKYNKNNQNNIKNFLELKNKLKPLCKNFVDFGNYLSENVELD